MTLSCTAAEHEYLGERSIKLTASRYEAVLLPNAGGNLISFRDVVSGSRILHEPESIEALRKFPFIYGIPVLIPPNRYEDGQLRWKNETYRLPVNEPAKGNHLHGFVHNIAWTLEAYGADNSESRALISLRVDEESPVFKYFPFRFTIRLKYTLSENGLFQQTTIRNDGDQEMPCLLAYHTALNAPFHPQGAVETCKLKMTFGDRWEMNERMLPTGRFSSLSEEELLMKGEGISPFWAPMDNHYTAVPQKGRNRIELLDESVGETLVYDAGTGFKQWMIWNNEATPGFFCPEPQVNVVNAPNMGRDPEELGLFSLSRGEIWEETSRLYLLCK